MQLMPRDSKDQSAAIFRALAEYRHQEAERAAVIEAATRAARVENKLKPPKPKPK